MKHICGLTLIVGMALSPALALGETGTTQKTLERLEANPGALRHMSPQHEFRGVDPTTYEPTMRRIALDSDLDWDLRARALTFLWSKRNQDVYREFAQQFDPVAVAATDQGAETFNVLAEWLGRPSASQQVIVSCLLPGQHRSGVEPILNALAGQDIYEYLYFLYRHDYSFQPSEIEALAETDDQLCRQFLNWYVGHQQIEGMENFLVSQIASPRPSNYSSKFDRVLLTVLTAGIGELIRSAIPTPDWIDDEATPKGLALESLGILIPVDSQDLNPALVESLLAAALTNSTGKKRGQWQLAIDILIFLDQHGVDLAGRADRVSNVLVRQAIRKRGPLVPLVEIERLHRESGLPFPPLTDEEKTALWDVTFKTFDGAFLIAVSRVAPNEKRQAELREHLLGLSDQAIRGTLSTVRCWGADIERTDDWILAVARLNITEAVQTIEKILEGWDWTDESIEAMLIFGPAGVPSLERYLRTPAADRLDTQQTIEVIRACHQNLPEADWTSLLLHLRTRQYLQDAANQVAREKMHTQQKSDLPSH